MGYKTMKNRTEKFETALAVAEVVFVVVSMLGVFGLMLGTHFGYIQ